MSWDPRQAETIERLAEFGLSYLQSEIGADRILIVHPQSDGAPPEPLRELGFGDQAIPPASELLDEVARDGRATIAGTVRAAVTAVLTAGDSQVVGFLYADRERGLFEPDELDETDEFARSYSECLAGLLGAREAAEAGEPELDEMLESAPRPAPDPLELPSVLKASEASTAVPFEVSTRVLVDWL